MTDKQSVVIIGGGPAGLTAAWELIKDGGADKYDVTVLEGTREFGGISRTVKHNGNRMDIGGHRFFSKDASWIGGRPFCRCRAHPPMMTRSSAATTTWSRAAPIRRRRTR